ncbi:hypothetical protein AX16_010382 [Volvariella volvacea WC 439]|nr:hypothetical protein AX16_010382 [Volvariella volvacea WC 439]
MAIDTNKPVALVFGGSGRTGKVIVEALLERNEFQVKIVTRPAQGTLKPDLVSFQSRGVEITFLDLHAASHSDLVSFFQLHKPHTIICSLFFTDTHLQTNLVDAAVAAGGVKRFVTSDWGTPGRRGARKLHDEKWAIRDYVRQSGLGYTYIDVGFWFSNLIENPYGDVYAFLRDADRIVYNDGNVKTALIDLNDIGQYVARIVSDERTLNRYVFVWGEEVTQNRLVELVKKYSGKDVDIIHKTTEDLEKAVQEARQDPAQFAQQAWYEYQYSMWILGENIKEKAVLDEYGSALLGTDLYPDIVPKTAEEYTKEWFRTSA